MYTSDRSGHLGALHLIGGGLLLGGTLLASVPSAHAQCVSADAPVAHWTGDVDATDAEGDSDATLTSLASAGVAEGVIGNAFAFSGWDGTTGGIAETELVLPDVGSLAMWVKPTGAPVSINAFAGTESSSAGTGFGSPWRGVHITSASKTALARSR